MIYTIEKNASAEIVVKKSKFIANIFYIESEQQAKELIEKISKKYYDAKHNCYAYIVLSHNISIEKSSDNGEPSGTAGAPMLEVLKKKKLTNVLVVVTRYFGGILLGTGGLVKAYTESLILALDEAGICKKEMGNRYKVEIEYDKIREFEYYCEQFSINIIDKTFEQNIKITIETTGEKFDNLLSKFNKELKSSILERDILILC